MAITTTSQSKNALTDEPVESVALMCRSWRYRLADVVALIENDTLDAVQHPGGGWYVTGQQARAALAYLETNGVPPID